MQQINIHFKKMKKVIVAIMVSLCGIVSAQEVEKDTIKKVSLDSLAKTVNEHSEKFAGYEEKFSGLEAIVNELSKIKVSGYIQAQYETYDTWSSDGTVHGIPVSGSNSYEDNSFYIRRARIKFTYKPIDGVNLVLQPNFEVHQVTMKDAYVQLNDRWLNTFSLWVGQFNRPTYEIEYSSASREFAERTLMTRTLYPQERDQGVKLEADFVTQYNFPLKLQFAILNGNFGQGSLSSQAKDVDNAKDFMARGVYSLKMMNNSLGIDFGAHTYLGHTTVIAQTTPPTVFTDVNNNPFIPKVGDKFKKDLFGGELQAYYDFLGGMSLKGEYIRGTYSGTTNTAQVNSLFNANKIRNIEGYYIAFVKNLGKLFEASVRYDVFDPNTKMSGDAITNAGELKYYNWNYALQYFFNDNIKVMASYLMPINEKSQNAGADFKSDKHDNTFTLRVQARF